MKINLNLNYWIFLILSVFCSINGLAQREKNNIYLFDCTGSMKTNGLWDPAKAALEATIETQSSIQGSLFTIIPFGDAPYNHHTFTATEFKNKKAEINADFDKNIKIAKYTRITDVLQSGFNKIDPNKENKIYLLTDGKPNNGDSPEKVAQAITNWCANHSNSRLFYVALTNDVINPIIKQAIDNCPDAFVVQCNNKVIPQIADISSDIYTNLQELSNSKALSFSLPGNYDLEINSNDSLFNVIGSKASNGKIMLALSPKNGLDINKLHQILQGNEYMFPITIQCADKRFFIANPNVSIHVSDEIPSTLTLAQGKEELSSNEAIWFDSFLWSDEAPEQKVEWDLSPIFTNEISNSNISLKFQTPQNEEDFNAWFNGNPIKNGDILTIKPGVPAILQIVFNHDAQTGKRYFNLNYETHSSIDLVNDQPVNDYTGTSLRTEYSVEWNPLKKFLTWLSIILISCIILWILFLKRIFFPTIKLSKVEFIGPGSYYTSKRIKGARKVVLTSKKQSQNIFSRILLGEIRYIKADHFIPELTILPASNKKRIKFQGNGTTTWDIYPSTIFNQYEKGFITNRNTKDKTEFEFS